MVKQLKLGGQKIKTAYWSLVGTATAMMLSVQPMLAANDTIWTRFSTIMKDIYGQLVGISTIVAVTMAAVALLVRMISRNEALIKTYAEFGISGKKSYAKTAKNLADRIA